LIKKRKGKKNPKVCGSSEMLLMVENWGGAEMTKLI
jgi:hypothetical protein